MEKISALLALCEGNPPVTVDSSSKGVVTRSFDASLMLIRTNCWTNTQMAGDLGGRGTHVTSLHCNMAVAKPDSPEKHTIMTSFILPVTINILPVEHNKPVQII